MYSNFCHVLKYGLFGSVSDTSTIRDLEVSANISVTLPVGMPVEFDYFVGGIVGDSSGTITGCTYSGKLTVDSVSISEGLRTGGIAGVNSGTISGCTFRGEIEAFYGFNGDIVGLNDGGTLSDNKCPGNPVGEQR